MRVLNSTAFLAMFTCAFQGVVMGSDSNENKEKKKEICKHCNSVLDRSELITCYRCTMARKEIIGLREDLDKLEEKYKGNKNK